MVCRIATDLPHSLASSLEQYLRAVAYPRAFPRRHQEIPLRVSAARQLQTCPSDVAAVVLRRIKIDHHTKMSPDTADRPEVVHLSCTAVHCREVFQISFTKPISTSLSIGTFKFAILLRVLWRTKRKVERRNDRQYGDALRMLISSFPMT